MKGGIKHQPNSEGSWVYTAIVLASTFTVLVIVVLSFLYCMMRKRSKMEFQTPHTNDLVQVRRPQQTDQEHLDGYRFSSLSYQQTATENEDSYSVSAESGEGSSCHSNSYSHVTGNEGDISTQTHPEDINNEPSDQQSTHVTSQHSSTSKEQRQQEQHKNNTRNDTCIYLPKMSNDGASLLNANEPKFDINAPYYINATSNTQINNTRQRLSQNNDPDVVVPLLSTNSPESSVLEGAVGGEPSISHNQAVAVVTDKYDTDCDSGSSVLNYCTCGRMLEEMEDLNRQMYQERGVQIDRLPPSGQ